MPADEANELRELVKQADFYNLPAVLSATRSGADRFQYHITITDGNQQHSVDMNDAAVQGPVKLLINHLSNISRAASRNTRDK